MATTIQISKELQNVLNNMKMFDRETYEEIIWDILEDRMELSEETKKELEEARKEVKEGKFYTLEEVEKRLSK